jgi:hypothetical protein
LAGRGHFVVMTLDVHPTGLHLQHHVGAQVLEVIHRRGREVALLVARPVTEIVLFASAVPAPLVGVDVVKAVLGRGVEADAVKDEELGLRAEEGLIGDARLCQIGFGLLGDVAGIALVGLARARFHGVGNHHQRRRFAERVHERRIGHRDQQHVRFVNRLPAANRAGVKAKAVLKGVLFQLTDRVADVLPQTRQVGKAKVQHFGVVFGRKFKNCFRIHGFSLENRFMSKCFDHPEERNGRR